MTLRSCAGPPPGWRGSAAPGRSGSRPCGGPLVSASPGWSEIDRQLRGTMTELFAASLRRGEEGAPTVEEVRRKNLALQQERAELLAAHGSGGGRPG